MKIKMNSEEQQDLFDHFSFGDARPKLIKLKSESQNIYPFNAKVVLDHYHQHLVNITKTGAEYVREFDDKKNPYRKGLDEYKAWERGIKFCGALQQSIE